MRIDFFFSIRVDITFTVATRNTNIILSKKRCILLLIFQNYVFEHIGCGRNSIKKTFMESCDEAGLEKNFSSTELSKRKRSP